ncbi:MAG: hypothetical protein ACYDB3_04190, partial [Acidimicrobiales bacterium]
PEIPVVANVDARAHGHAADWPGLLSAQLCSPVRWRHTLEVLGQMGAAHVVEVGPGGVLSGLARRTLPGTTALAVHSPDDLHTLVDALAGGAVLDQVPAAVHQGEQLHTAVRLVVSPSTGVFQPAALPAPAPGAGLRGAASPPPDPDGTPVEVGALLGRVGEFEVRTPFAGRVVAYLAHAGERVVTGQPVAWLRVAAGAD